MIFLDEDRSISIDVIEIIERNIVVSDYLCEGIYNNFLGKRGYEYTLIREQDHSVIKIQYGLLERSE